MPPSTTQAHLSRTIDAHGATLEEHTLKLNQHDFILNGAGESSGLVQEVKDHKTSIETMEKLWVRQGVLNGILTFVASLMGAAMFALIWGLITGSVVIV